jgi:hypothetical protein
MDVKWIQLMKCILLLHCCSFNNKCQKHKQGMFDIV